MFFWKNTVRYLSPFPCASTVAYMPRCRFRLTSDRGKFVFVTGLTFLCWAVRSSICLHAVSNRALTMNFQYVVSRPL